MAHTNHTDNLELSQFLSSDKPSWLNDYNGDMLKIDAGVAAAASSASDAYTKAEKARKAQAKTANERYNDLITLGAPAREEGEELADYINAIRESGINTVSEGIDMLAMYQAAMAVLAVKTKAVEDIKAAGNWTWRRPVAVDLNTFADLIENYVADCLMDGYNIKSSKVIREEKAEARKAAKAEKETAQAA